MISRRWKIPAFENMHIPIGNSVQLSLKIGDKSLTKQYINKLINEVTAFHLRLDNGYLYELDPSDRVEVQYLPKFNSLADVNQFAINNMQPDMKKRLGNIAANEDTIVFNMNHICGDGGFLRDVIHQINDGIIPGSNVNAMRRQLNTYFPHPITDAFKERIEKMTPNQPVFMNDDEGLTRIFGSKPKEGRECSTILKYPIESLACYDKSSKKCSNLNESICSSFILSALVSNFLSHSSSSDINNFENMLKLTPFGIQILVDIRKYATIPVTLNSTNWFSSYNIHATPTLKMKMGELYSQLKKDLIDQTKDDRLFKFIEAFNYSNPKPYDYWPNKVFLNNSNLGPLKITEPIKDVFITNVNYTVPFRDMFPILTYSLSDDHGRNEMISIIRYHMNGISESHAKLMNQSTKYSLQHINKNMTVLEAINAIKKFQINHY